MTRIAVGAFLHETNTFAPTRAYLVTISSMAGLAPSMAHGADVLKVMRKINVGLAGFVEAAEANGWELVPADDLGGRGPVGACHQGCIRTRHEGDGRRHRCGRTDRCRLISICMAPW